MRLDWKKIKTVFFDMDGTLLDLNFDNHFWLEYVPQKYAQKFQLNIKKSKEKLFPKYKSMEGKLEWYCIDYWTEQLDLDILELKRECSDMISIRASVKPLLIFLQKQGIKIIMATNAHPNTMHLKLEISLLHHHFDELYTSHDFGYPKEDPKFWDQMHTKCAFKNENSLFIDDNLEILNVAHNYGIAYCLGIKKPDSKGSDKVSEKFDIIEDFSELINSN